ncbi:MAG: formate dehydrogenase accessory protein FdhE [Gallionellaceae bacterium]|nr:formate dehydrogenase accessory protein FdhE [Gallionellaceae bacterium]
MNTETRVLEPGQIEAPAGQIPFLRLARPDVFKQRAERLLQLSLGDSQGGHSIGGYLALLATLAQAQQQALDHFPAAPLPTPEQQALCREHGMPVLGAQAWPRDPSWRGVLKTILQHMAAAPLTAPASAVVARLMQTGGTELESIASKLLAGDLSDVDAQDMPFVAAALQVYWVRMAAELGEHAFGKLEQGGLCPVCGSHPVAGIVRVGGMEQGLRYLCCSLCATEWHMVRIKCSNCESTHKINYYTLENSNGAVKAESCNDCNTYLKLLYLEKDSQMEAVADDLATLALDVLMGETGKVRGGLNLFFHPGSAQV